MIHRMRDQAGRLLETGSANACAVIGFVEPGLALDVL
jgi:hypothetical protein